MNRAILVMGTGRSGTSAVAGMLHKMGVYMGSAFTAPSAANPYGWYEDKEWYIHVNEVLMRHARPDFPSLVAERNEHKVWGVKIPLMTLVAEYVLPCLPDPRIVLTRRAKDSCLVSSMRAFGWSLAQADSWHDTMTGALDKHLAEFGGPVLEVQWADVLANPQITAQQLAAFAFEGLGLPSQAAIDKAAGHIQVGNNGRQSWDRL